MSRNKTDPLQNNDSLLQEGIMILKCYATNNTASNRKKNILVARQEKCDKSQSF